MQCEENKLTQHKSNLSRVPAKVEQASMLCTVSTTRCLGTSTASAQGAYPAEQHPDLEADCVQV